MNFLVQTTVQIVIWLQQQEIDFEQAVTLSKTTQNYRSMFLLTYKMWNSVALRKESKGNDNIEAKFSLLHWKEIWLVTQNEVLERESESNDSKDTLTVDWIK